MQKLTVFIPCYNEEGSIGKTVLHVKEAMKKVMGRRPYRIRIYDNMSTDGTYRKALELAKDDRLIEVSRCMEKGKGNVFRQFLEDFAEGYPSDDSLILMVDGDDTYGLDGIPPYGMLLMKDMWTGEREGYGKEEKKGYHRAGNRFIRAGFRKLYHEDYDIFSGLRVFRWGFLKSFVSRGKAFTLETELAFHSHDTHASVGTFPSEYRDREEGKSKIRLRDGFEVFFCFGKRAYKDYGIFLRLFLYIPAVIIGIRRRK